MKETNNIVCLLAATVVMHLTVGHCCTVVYLCLDYRQKKVVPERVEREREWGKNTRHEDFIHALP